jgi:hypothetical protein
VVLAITKGALKGNVQAFAALTDLIEVLVNVSRIKESKPYFKSRLCPRNFCPRNFRKCQSPSGHETLARSITTSEK